MITNLEDEQRAMTQDIFWQLVSHQDFELNEQGIAKALRHAFTCSEAFFKACTLQKQNHPERDLLSITKELEKALNALPEDQRNHALSGLGKAISQSQVNAKPTGKAKKG
jgi:hypothetical protein